MRGGEEQEPEIETEEVMSPQNADTMTSMLEDVIEKAMVQELTLVLLRMPLVKLVQPKIMETLGLLAIRTKLSSLFIQGLKNRKLMRKERN